MTQHKLETREIRLAPDQIVAEAKRWGIEDEVGLRVSQTGAVTIAVGTSRGRQFVDHLTSVLERESASGVGPWGEDGGPRDCPALHEIQSAEWLEVARWAGEIEAAVLSGKRPPAAIALKLARAVIAMNREARTTGIVVRPEGIVPT
jgi:hypothetical protein